MHNLGGLRLRSKIIGEPFLSMSSCGGQPDGFSEFKNSTGKLIISPSSVTVSTE